MEEEMEVKVFADAGLPDPATLTAEEWARLVEQTARWPLDVARSQAARVADVLRPACTRVLVAGSVRRGKADVGDVEIVCQVSGVWHQVSAQMALEDGARGLSPLSEGPSIEDVLAGMVERGELAPRGADGPRMKKFWVVVNAGPRLKLDLFIVRPPAQWGVILAIRTGPAEYSKWLVTHARAVGMHVEHGALWRFGQAVATPEETDFFRALGLAWELPEQRAAGKNKMLAEA